ncbi:MAG: amidohydrolase, partial [Spirochaetia bacterium]|nr:amidohydrolase [Spirochaetia bacterium]
YMKEGILVALGTDGSSSNNTLDMFKEMRLTAMISGASTHNPTAITPYDVLSMATINGAKALKRDHNSGSIEVGKDADITLINRDKAHLSPMNNPFSAVVFGSSSQDVETVIIKGEIVYKEKEFTHIDIEKTNHAINKRWEEIKKRM